MENLRSIRFYQKCTIKHHDSSKHFKDESKRQVHYKENNHVDSYTSLAFHVGTAFKPQSVCDEVLATNDSLAMSVSTLDFYSSKNISNLSIALSQEISDPTKDIYTGSKMDRQETSDASQVPIMHLQAPADRHLTLIL